MKKKHDTPYIDDVQITSDCMTGRAGLNLFVRYLRSVDIYSDVTYYFSTLRRSNKGASVESIFQQVLCFLFDGTSKHLRYFENLAKDHGYAAAIETAPKAMVSSHTVKRFYRSFSQRHINCFRCLLQKMFLQRLKISKPEIIELNIDTMVMNNNYAVKREGVEPTYKQVLGFQPLQMTWGRHIIDAIFRSGEKHSLHGDDVPKMIRHTVQMIRRHFSQTTPIIIRMDSGFFDQALFAEIEHLNIGFICAGKFYGDIKNRVKNISESDFQHHFGKTDEDVWEYYDFTDRRKSWAKEYRTIFWRPLLEEKQFLLPGTRPGTIVYTNLGMGGLIDKQLQQDFSHMLRADAILHCYHQRGADELVHRAFKDFAFEELPFQGFMENAAFYYTMLIGFFLFESFKEDVTSPWIPVTSLPTTLRRQVVDLAAKVVSHAGKRVLKLTAFAINTLKFKELWLRCTQVPRCA